MQYVRGSWLLFHLIGDKPNLILIMWYEIIIPKSTLLVCMAEKLLGFIRV